MGSLLQTSRRTFLRNMRVHSEPGKSAAEGQDSNTFQVGSIFLQREVEALYTSLL